MGPPRFGPDPFHGKGNLISQTETIETWVMEVSPGVWAKCENEWVGPILDANQEALNNSIGQRFGDGQVVASIPLGLYYDKIVPAKKQGDTAYIKRILNDSDFGKLRTFGGRL